VQVFVLLILYENVCSGACICFDMRIRVVYLRICSGVFLYVNEFLNAWCVSFCVLCICWVSACVQLQKKQHTHENTENNKHVLKHTKRTKKTHNKNNTRTQ